MSQYVGAAAWREEYRKDIEFSRLGPIAGTKPGSTPVKPVEMTQEAALSTQEMGKGSCAALFFALITRWRGGGPANRGRREK